MSCFFTSEIRNNCHIPYSDRYIYFNRCKLIFDKSVDIYTCFYKFEVEISVLFNVYVSYHNDDIPF